MERDLPKDLNQQTYEIYMKILEIESVHTRTRWTNTSFFLTASFAIFGLSFQTDKSQMIPSLLIAQRVGAIIIYWFAFLLFLRFNDYSEFLRAYLRELEETKIVPVDLACKAHSFMKAKKRPSSTKLLLLFGVIYTIGVLVILFLR